MLPLAHISPLTALLPTDGSATDNDIISTACTFSVWQNASGNGLGAMLTLDRLQLHFMQSKSSSSKTAHAARSTAVGSEGATGLSRGADGALPQPPQPKLCAAIAPESRASASPAPQPRGSAATATVTKPPGPLHLHLFPPREEVREDVMLSIVQTFVLQEPSVPRPLSSGAVQLNTSSTDALVTGARSTPPLGARQPTTPSPTYSDALGDYAAAAAQRGQENAIDALGIGGGKQAAQVESEVLDESLPLDFGPPDPAPTLGDAAVPMPQVASPLTPPASTSTRKASQRYSILSPPPMSSVRPTSASTHDNVDGEKSFSLDVSAIDRDATPSYKLAVLTPSNAHADTQRSRIVRSPEVDATTAAVSVSAPTSVQSDATTQLGDDRAAKYRRIEHVATPLREPASSTPTTALVDGLSSLVSSVPFAHASPPEGLPKNVSALQVPPPRTVPLPKRTAGAPPLSTQRRAFRAGTGGRSSSGVFSAVAAAPLRPPHTELFALPVQPPSPSADNDRSRAAAPAKVASQAIKPKSPPPQQQQQRSVTSAPAPASSTSAKRPPRVYHPPS